MPLLTKNRAKSLQSNSVSRMRTDSAGCTGLWSVSFGLAAISVAAIVFFAGQDRLGAALVMLAAAGIVAVMMSASVLVEE